MRRSKESKRYTLYNLSEEDMEQLLTTITTERSYSRTAEQTELISVDFADESFLDGTPKYKIEISSDNDELKKRFGHKK